MAQPIDQGSEGFDLEPIPFTPDIVRAARAIYKAYVDTHGNRQSPIGVALDRYTLRGQPIFVGQPILLPHECFVPMRQIELLELDIEATEE